MGPVLEDILPVYSTPKHLFTSSSLRRRRVFLLLLTFVGFLCLIYWRLCQPVVPRHRPPPRLPAVAPSPFETEAEETYHLGSVSSSDYRASLDWFITTAFPSPLRPQLSKSLHRFLQYDSTEPLPEVPKIIWQTNDIHPDTPTTRSWGYWNPEHGYHFLYDEDGDEWIRHNFKGSIIQWVWDFLPHPVMKADLLRYLLLLVGGGVYSDIDTYCLKPIHDWGSNPDITWEAGRGSPPSAIIGVEADVGSRADWHKWWSRPLQIVQWTMAFSPGHPILLDAVQRIYANTIEAERRLQADPNLDRESILEKNMTILEWTGPAVFTDASLRFLQIESGLRWMDLRGLIKPLRAGSVTVLPVTGFSPGVGNFGAKEVTDKQAMVYHDFKGSWKLRHPDVGR